MCGTDVLTIGKDVNTIVAGTQSLCHIPINRYALLFTRIFDILTDAVFKLTILVGKGSSFGEDVARGSCDANIKAADAC